MTRLVRSALLATAGLLALTTSCNVERPIAPRQTVQATPFTGPTSSVISPPIVISQVYGGGGNAGAVYKNDFIELFNPGAFPVNITGWSVQYAAATASSWQVTALTGTVPAGGYYLVQEGPGAGGTTSLPAPDATGNIALSATAGKVWLVGNSGALNVACPSGFGIVDQVSFGTTASDCGFGRTAAPSNTAAVLRNSQGCAYTTSLPADFAAGAPTPRNSASPAHDCGNPPVPGVITSVTVTPSDATLIVGQDTTFVARAFDGLGTEVTGVTFAWAGGISGNGGYHAASVGDHIISAAAPNSISGTATAHVLGVPVVASVVVTPAATSAVVGGTQQFTAKAFDAGNAEITGVTFTWNSTAGGVATVDATGLATAVSAGDTHIEAKAPNNVTGSASLHVDVPVAPPAAGDVVISQAYGGGGNAGATLKNDFIEIFNRGTNTVSLAGWSVQHTSAGGTTWTVTPLTGSIPAGGYYLIQESAGAGGTVNLPTPDATGAIQMGATSGKDLVATTTTAFTVACPSGASVIDIVSYGSGTNCGVPAAAPSNTAGEQRKHAGCTWTQNSANDLVVAAPAPRNSASPVHSCVAGPLDHVNVTGSLQVIAGSTTQLSAEALDVNSNEVAGAVITWSSGDESIATVSATGLVTGVAASNAPVSITATAVANAVTKSGSVSVLVNSPGINWIDISTSSSSLPPGFQTQLFATARTQQGGTVVNATFTFEAMDPQYATIQTVANTGLISTVSAPSDASKPGFRITATPTAGGTPYVLETHPVTVEQPNPAPSSIYAVNDDFGDPTPASVSNPNDFLIRRDQYTLSYNQSRGTPNWVSYELDARQMVAGQDRCNCFTGDPLLPQSARIFTSDYTNGGYDRGHMTRSADRTAGNVDNAITFYLTNVVPQFGPLNQGVWAQFENMLGDSARAGRAVYIITGPLYSRSHGLTYIKNEGKIAIPDSTWKVALIGPGNGGNPFTHGNVQSFDDLVGLTLMAVNMPNLSADSSIRNDPPSKYFTTVDKIELATGYDVLSLLQVGMQQALQYHDRKPVAQFSVSGATTEGSTLTFDASASTDADLGRTDMDRAEALTYSWHFSDGANATGAVVTHTVNDNGTFSATLTVTDAFGWPASSTSSVAITNVAPTASLQSPVSVDQGSAFALALTGATDVSTADASAGFTYAFDCGDGAGYSSPSTSSSISCPTGVPGSRAVRGRVMDKDGGATEYTASVAVNNVAPSIAAIAGATLLPGETYSTTSSFADPGADAWTATVNYGDGSGVNPLLLGGQTFSLSHVYAATGSFTVTVAVSDGYVTTTRTQTVVVQSQSQGVQNIEASIDQLVTSGALNSGNGNSLTSKLDAAVKQLQKGNTTPARNQLNAALNEIDAMLSSGRLSPADAAALKAAIHRVLNSL